MWLTQSALGDRFPAKHLDDNLPSAFRVFCQAIVGTRVGKCWTQKTLHIEYGPHAADHSEKWPSRLSLN
jgi:hypothetical protein